MTRLPWMRRLAQLQLTASAAHSPTRAPFSSCRAISSTCAAREKNTDWVRGKLWKGEAPGSEDPYTQRPEPQDPSDVPEETSELPRADKKIPEALLNSRLTLPPRRTEAVTETESKYADPSYVPATDAEGLEEISTLKAWWDQEGHWGEESEFKGFGSPEKVVDKNVVEVYLRQSVVEALSLRDTGVFSEWSTRKWRKVSRSDLDQALAADIQVRDGRASLKEADSAFISRNLVSEADDVEAVAKFTPQEALEMVKAWNPLWKDVILDEQLKFAIRKRLYQLTGILIPDAKLGAARTIKHVLTLIAKQPKPMRLAELLESRSDIGQLANVKVHRRKIGPVEKETAVGRWKVIEDELTKRGLPVTGTAGLSKNKERDWIMGKM